MDSRAPTTTIIDARRNPRYLFIIVSEDMMALNTDISVQLRHILLDLSPKHLCIWGLSFSKNQGDHLSEFYYRNVVKIVADNHRCKHNICYVSTYADNLHETTIIWNRFGESRLLKNPITPFPQASFARFNSIDFLSKFLPFIVGLRFTIKTNRWPVDQLNSIYQYKNTQSAMSE